VHTLIPFIELTPEQHRQRRISIQQAAAIKNLSVASFRRHYAHIIEHVSPRRLVVRLCDVLD
jgi:hypothetical protein